MKTWICPGSFDPVTSGHLDIIQRAAKRCDSLIVAVGINDKKVPSFSTEERKSMLEKVTADIENVKVTVFSGLLIPQLFSLPFQQVHVPQPCLVLR